MGILALVVFLGSALVPRWAPLRSLGAERRLQWMAALCLACLLLLHLSVPAVNQAILAGAAPAFHMHLLITLAGICAALALGLAWSPAVDDSRRGLPRAMVVLLFLVPLLGSLLGAAWLPILALPVAARTGWSRGVAEERHPLATLMSIIGLVAVLAWPSLTSPSGSILTSGGPTGASMFAFARIYLIAQLGLLALRYVLGLIFGPRRIGRRLLISHMLAGLVPVALLALFAVLITLLSLANFRARAAVHLLSLQDRFSEEMLARSAGEALEEIGLRQRAPGSHWSPELLYGLSVGIRERWPRIASWEPAPASGKPGAASGEPPQPDYIHLAYRSSRGGFAILNRATQDDSLMVPVYAWLTRPYQQGGCGLIKTQGATLHVADYRLAVGREADSSYIRIQLVERLPAGRVQVLNERLDGRARIEEEFRYRLNERGGLEFISAEAIQATADRDAEPAGRQTSLFNSGTGYRLLPAQEWIPAEDGLPTPDASEVSADSSAASAAAPRGEQDVLGQWGRIRLAVLGIATLRDLVPALPTSGNPVEYFPIIILGTVLVVFVGVETFAFFSALRMGRSIAQSVSGLRFGTERLRQGDLSHRLEIAGQDELSNLAEAFNEMAVGLEEGRRTLVEKERLESELALARQIQQRLLPAHPPEIPGLLLAGVSVPAREVGGDYYDFVRIDDGRLLVAMADVSGKGAPAALLMSSLRASLHSMLHAGSDLSRLACQLNKFVHASTSDSEFITLFFGLIDPRTGRFCYVNAGHEYPFVVRNDGRLERLTDGGLMMGAFAEAPYQESNVELGPGDLLFLFTDGLTEAHGPDDQMFGEERCEACLRTHAQSDPQQILRAALGSVDDFVRGAEATDDITLLAIRRLGSL